MSKRGTTGGPGAGSGGVTGAGGPGRERLEGLLAEALEARALTVRQEDLRRVLPPSAAGARRLPTAPAVLVLLALAAALAWALLATGRPDHGEQPVRPAHTPGPQVTSSVPPPGPQVTSSVPPPGPQVTSSMPAPVDGSPPVKSTVGTP